MKRGLIHVVELICKDGKLVYYFEEREDAIRFEAKATAFTSNVCRSCWTFEKAGSQKTGSAV